MAAYFGNGYLLNVLQRGSALVGQLRPQPTPLARLDSIEATRALDASQVAREPTGQDPIHSSAERFERSVFSAGPKAVPPKESLTIGAVENISPTTGSESLPPEKYLAETNTSSAPADPREATKPELRSDVPALGPSSPPPLPIPIQTSIASIAERPPQESAPLVETQPKSHSASAVFELKMPKGFFGQPSPETGHAEEAETLVKRSDVSAPEEPTESHPAGPPTGSLDSAAEQHRAANDLWHVVTVKESIEPSDSQTFRLTPGKSIPESQAPPPPITRKDDVVSPADIEAPAARVTLSSFQASASAPRLEPTPEHLQLWQPPVAPAVAASPRLRINRLEVQVINYTPPRATTTPQTQAPDVSQLLEKRHLGRIDLLI